MELRVIGYWAAYPKTGEACSGYLINHKETRILLDCGHSVFSELGKYEDINRLDAVFISHFHPDHYVDLHALRHAVRSAMFQGKRQLPLKVYMPGKPEDIYKYWSEVPEFQVIKAKEGLRVEVKDLEMTFYNMEHSLPSLAVKLSAGSSTLFYTGDTAFNEKLVEAAKNVDVLLAETTMVRDEQDYAASKGHMSIRDVAVLADRCSPDLLVATHLWEGYSRDQIIREITEDYTGKVIVAHSGLKLKVSNTD